MSNVAIISLPFISRVGLRTIWFSGLKQCWNNHCFGDLDSRMLSADGYADWCWVCMSTDSFYIYIYRLVTLLEYSYDTLTTLYSDPMIPLMIPNNLGTKMFEYAGWDQCWQVIEFWPSYHPGYQLWVLITYLDDLIIIQVSYQSLNAKHVYDIRQKHNKITYIIQMPYICLIIK